MVLEPPSHLSHRPPRWKSHRCQPHQLANLQVPESPGARAIDPPTLPTHQTTGATDHHQGVWLTNLPEPPSTRATGSWVTGLPLATEPLKPPTHWLASHHVCFGSPISHQATIQPDHQPPGPQICHLPPHQTPDPLTHRCQKPPTTRCQGHGHQTHQTNCHPKHQGHMVTGLPLAILPPIIRCQGAKATTTKILDYQTPDPPTHPTTEATDPPGSPGLHPQVTGLQTHH